MMSRTDGKPRPPRYDRPFLLEALSTLEKEGGLGPQAALVFAEPGPPADLPQLSLDWLNALVAATHLGVPFDFQPLTDLVITYATSRRNVRRRICDSVIEIYQKLQAHGLVEGA